jgi:hypothetical protein
LNLGPIPKVILSVAKDLGCSPILSIFAIVFLLDSSLCSE